MMEATKNPNENQKKNTTKNDKKIKEPEPLPQHLLLGVNVNKNQPKNSEKPKEDKQIERPKEEENVKIEIKEKVEENIKIETELPKESNNNYQAIFNILGNNQLNQDPIEQIELYPKMDLKEEISIDQYQPNPIQHGNIEQNNSLLNNLMSSPTKIEENHFIDPKIDLTTAIVETPELHFVPENEYKSGSLEESEFYNLLMNYKSSYIKFVKDKSEVDDLEIDNENLSNNLWRQEKQVINLTKRCGDGIELHEKIEYNSFTFQNNLSIQLKTNLEKYRDGRMNRLTQSIHEYQSKKLAVENFLSKFLINSSLFSQIPKDAPVIAISTGSRDQISFNEMCWMRHYIDVLFDFERDKANHQLEHFYQDIQYWMEMLVEKTLKRADYSDHLFIVRQLLITPGCKWAAKFIQFPKVWDNDYCVTFFLQMLDELLSPFKKDKTRVSSNTLTEVVSKEKENTEDDLDDEYWVNIGHSNNILSTEANEEFILSSEDFESLFNQFPFSTFSSYIFDQSNPNSHYYYPSSVLEICTFLLKKMFLGLHSIYQYKYLSKLVGHMMMRILKNTAIFVYKTEEMKKLQQQRLDLLCINVARSIISIKKAKMWLLLQHLPFSYLSKQAQWIVFQVFLLSHKTTNVMGLKNWIHYLNENKQIENDFADQLCEEIQESEFLLDALSQLATETDEELAHAIGEEIVYVSCNFFFFFFNF